MNMSTENIKNARVLVVDDDVASRRLIAGFLAPTGAVIGEASDGREALAMIESSPWDAILLDLVMPVMDGLQVLEKIRMRPDLEKVPVILITSHTDAEARMNALRMRANDFLVKPVDQAELLARLEGVLALRNAYVAVENHVKEIERAKALRELLVNIFIHDLRNAITGVKGYVELAIDAMLDRDEWIAAHMQKALEGIDRIAKMASDAMDVNRLEEGKLRPKLADIVIDDVMKTRLDVALQMARRRNIIITLVVEKDLGPVRADPIMLERVLENLLITAMRNTPDGGKIKISAGRGEDMKRIAIRVEHTGWHPTASWQRSFFDVRAQEELSRQGYNIGTGQGLTFCRLAAECQNGGVWFEGGPDRDAVFMLQIPAVVPASAS